MDPKNKTALTELLALVFVISLSVGLSVLVSECGWGLQPKSWWWIIGGGVFGQTLFRWVTDKITK